MNREIFLSFSFHLLIIFGATLTLPFLLKKPIDLPPIISVELIQITEKTNIPFAPKAKKIIVSIIPNSRTRLNLLEKGNINLDIRKVSKLEGEKVVNDIFEHMIALRYLK